MNIYLIRHGEAEKASDDKPHELRELTARGVRLVETSTKLWKNYVTGFDLISSSPLKRAMQTALIIKEIFGLESDILEELSLLNGGLTEDLLNFAAAFGTENVAMIGHQPDLGAHIAKLTGQYEMNLKLPPATIAKISFQGSPIMGEGILEFLIPPIN